MFISKEMLQELRGYSGAAEVLAEAYPDGVTLTADVCEALAHDKDFEPDWLAWRLLPAELSRDYEIKKTGYKVEYKNKLDACYLNYRAKKDAADKAMALLEDTYLCEIFAMRGVFRLQKATTFGRLVELTQESTKCV